MWNTGFEKYLKGILDAFLGEISYEWKKGSTTFELTLAQKGEDVLVKLSEDELMYEEKFTYEELYNFLVPNNKLDYLYLFQDIKEEMSEEDAKEIVVKSYIDDLLKKMSISFVGRKNSMKVIEEEKEIEKVKEIPDLVLVPGFKFLNHGVEYEQLALF